MNDEEKEKFFKDQMRRMYNRDEEISDNDKDFKKMRKMEKSIDPLTKLKWSINVIVEKFNEDTSNVR